MSLLEVSHLRKTFNGNVVAVDDLSFHVDAGEVFGLVGPNGADKTTTMTMLAGLLKPDSGSIRIQGQPFDAGRNVVLHRHAVDGLSSAAHIGLDVGDGENVRSAVAPYFKHSPLPLATPRDLPLDDSGGEQFPRFRTITFDEADTEQIEMTAKRLGVSLNVLLLRDLFLILDQWNRLHSPDRRSRTIRVSIPINLRRPIDHRMPAAALDRRRRRLRIVGESCSRIEGLVEKGQTLPAINDCDDNCQETYFLT